MKTVWATANVGKHQDHGAGFVGQVMAHGDEAGVESDEIIVINSENNEILKRISIAKSAHLAHIVLTSDNAYAYVTAQTEGAIYKVNAKTYLVEKRIILPENSEPHGLRISLDGSVAYLAMLKNKSLGILNLKTDMFSEVPLGGQAVQTGITPDGKYAMASLYDTKQLMVYLIDTKEIRTIQLPENAKGPIQMYATPDSKFVYLADQGYYFDQPASEWVYKIDLGKLEVIKEIKAGQGPHGVAVSEDGTRVYVTNLLSGDVSIINTTTDQEIGRVKVGKEPNGVSVWVKR
jgi:YVTN family beta-propeller protein